MSRGDEGPATEAERSVRWLITGRVQGVGFRYHVSEAASTRGLEGDVRNLPDGRVEIRLRGASGMLEDMLAVVRRGPAFARVDGVEQQELDPSPGFDGFRVRF